MRYSEITQLVALIASVAVPTIALSADIVPLQLGSQCSTDPTDWDGKGHSCVAEPPSCTTAPTGYVIAVATVIPKLVAGNGPSSQCQVWYTDPVEVIPGSHITQPSRACLRAYAESGSGHAGVRGSANCLLNGDMTRYTQ
jgi:hypothetical protein